MPVPSTPTQLRARVALAAAVTQEERHLARHQFERDVVKPQHLIATVQREDDRTARVSRAHDL